MEFFDKVSKTVSDTGQKAKEMADVATLNNKVSANERQIKDLYTQLGDAYYQVHSEDPETGFSPMVTQITDLQNEIKEWNEQIQQLKGNIKCPNCGEYVDGKAYVCPHCGQSLLPEGSIVCPQCGAVIEEGMAFCQYCGARLDAQPEAAEELEPGQIRCTCGALLEKDDLFCAQCGKSRQELEQG